MKVEYDCPDCGEKVIHTEIFDTDLREEELLGRVAEGVRCTNPECLSCGVARGNTRACRVITLLSY